MRKTNYKPSTQHNQFGKACPRLTNISKSNELDNFDFNKDQNTLSTSSSNLFKKTWMNIKSSMIKQNAT